LLLVMRKSHRFAGTGTVSGLDQATGWCRDQAWLSTKFAQL